MFRKVQERVARDELPERARAGPGYGVGQEHLVVGAEAHADGERVHDAPELRTDLIKRCLAIVGDGERVPFFAGRAVGDADDVGGRLQLRAEAEGELASLVDEMGENVFRRPAFFGDGEGRRTVAERVDGSEEAQLLAGDRVEDFLRGHR